MTRSKLKIAKIVKSKLKIQRKMSKLWDVKKKSCNYLFYLIKNQASKGIFFQKQIHKMNNNQ